MKKTIFLSLIGYSLFALVMFYGIAKLGEWIKNQPEEPDFSNAEVISADTLEVQKEIEAEYIKNTTVQCSVDGKNWLNIPHSNAQVLARAIALKEDIRKGTITHSDIVSVFGADTAKALFDINLFPLARVIEKLPATVTITFQGTNKIKGKR